MHPAAGICTVVRKGAFNGEVSRPYLITFYGNYKEEMTEEQITALKDKINNYIITHALY